MGLGELLPASISTRSKIGLPRACTIARGKALPAWLGLGLGIGVGLGLGIGVGVGIGIGVGVGVGSLE